LSSKAETFGVVLIEALALGKPVVATRCGGPESIIREEDGILVPVDDVPKLGDGMKEIRRQYGNYRPIELRRSCANRFSEKAVTRQLIDIYRQVLAEPKRHTAA
jgi:glycosyltransferase involved in cell wall biosynthesis